MRTTVSVVDERFNQAHGVTFGIDEDSKVVIVARLRSDAVFFWTLALCPLERRTELRRKELVPQILHPWDRHLKE